MKNELLPAKYQELSPTVFFQDNGEMIEIATNEIKSKVEKFKTKYPDVTKDAGRKKIGAFARKISSSKTFIDSAGKELVADIKKKALTIDNLRKTWRDSCDEMRDDILAPRVKWEDEQRQKKEEQKQKAQAGIDEMVSLYYDLNGTGTQDKLNFVIKSIEETQITPSEFFELTAEAEQTKERILAAARNALETRKRLDIEEAERKKAAEETERLRVKLEAEQKALEKARIEHEAKIKAEAEAAKKIEEEKQRLMAQAEEQKKFEEEKAQEIKRFQENQPDKVKLYQFMAELDNIKPPNVQSEEAKQICRDILRRIESVVTSLHYQINQKFEQF